MSEPQYVLGWKSIALALRVGRDIPHVNTVQRWARRNVDPLPVMLNHLGVYADAGAIVAWSQRQVRSLRLEDELRRLRATARQA